MLIPWHKHWKSHCLQCVFAICNSQHWQTDNTNNRRGEHPISGDMYKHTSCLIAILIIIASIAHSQAPPHLLWCLTWHLPDNVSHLFIHCSANTPSCRCTYASTLSPMMPCQPASFPDAALQYHQAAFPLFTKGRKTRPLKPGNEEPLQNVSAVVSGEAITLQFFSFLMSSSFSRWDQF